MSDFSFLFNINNFVLFFYLLSCWAGLFTVCFTIGSIKTKTL